MVDYDKAYNLVDDVIVKGSIENYFSTKQTMASCHSFSPNKSKIDWIRLYTRRLRPIFEVFRIFSICCKVIVNNRKCILHLADYP